MKVVPSRPLQSEGEKSAQGQARGGKSSPAPQVLNAPQAPERQHAVRTCVDFSSRLLSVQQKLQEQSKFPVGGRLRFFWKQWQKLGAPKTVIRWFRRGYPLPFKREGGQTPSVSLSPSCPPGLVTSYAPGSEKLAALQAKVQELLNKQVIAEVPEGCPAFHNRVFLRPKRTGGWRLILDVSQLNSFLHWDTFKMDHIAVIRVAAEKGMWATSVDFSDAYHHIPIRAAHYKFLCFQVGSKRYWYLALPFGLSPAPRIFTVVLRPVKLWARAAGLQMFQYLDDWLNMAKRQAQAQEQTLVFVEKCVELGLMVNLQKSELSPTQVIDFLGFTLDFSLSRIFPQREKLLTLRSRLHKVLREKVLTLKSAESLRGTLTSLEKAVPWGRLNFRYFQRQVSRALKQGRAPEKCMILSRESQADLRWWAEAKHTAPGCPFTPDPPTCTLQTDASESGWGAYFGTRVLQGQWSEQQRSLHINVLELLAVRMAVETLAEELRGQTVLCLIDNMTVVAHINRQGGTRSQKLLAITKKLVDEVRRLECTLHARHLRGALNAIADLASRQGKVVSTEWRLTSDAFRWVSQSSSWGPPSFELFANSLNHHLRRFGSPCPDPRASLVDALSAAWPRNEVLYAFPPTIILPQVIEKMKQEKGARVLLVAPLIPAAPWFPQVRRWAVKAPRPLPLLPNPLRQPHWSYQHPQPETMRLHLYQVKIPY